MKTLRTIAGAAALTLGHTVLAQTRADAEYTRDHELVHVQQYERWGPLFLPAYLLASVWAHLAGRHYYRDNAFEAEAVAATDARSLQDRRSMLT